MHKCKLALLSASLLGIGVVVGFVAGRFTPRDETTVWGRTVAMSWGDSKYGPAFYGACVYLQPAGEGLSVRGLVAIGPGNDYWHDCGELGRAKSHEEAVQKWGTVTWKADGLCIGNGGPSDYFLPRSRLESHR